MLERLKNLRTSLTYQATAMAFILGTVPVAATGAIGFLVANNNFTNTITEAKQDLVQETSRQIDVYMYERLLDIDMMVNLDIFTDPKIRNTITPAQQAQALTRILNTYGAYDSIALFDTKGNVIAQTGSKSLGNKLNKTYIQDALKTKKPVLSQPIFSENNGTTNVYAASVVKDKVSGEIIGFIRARTPISIIAEIVKRSQGEAEESKIYLTDKQGNLFLAPVDIQAGDINSENKDSLTLTKFFPNLETKLDLTQSYAAANLRNAQSNRAQFVAYASGDSTYTTSGLDWDAFLAEDINTLFAGRNQLRWTILLGTLLTGLLATIIATTLIRRTSKSLSNIAEELTQSSENISSTVEAQEGTVTNQANSVSLTTSTMDQLGSTSLQSAVQAESSNSDALEALELAKEGSQSVEEAIIGINTLKEQVNAIAEQIMSLSEQTGEIVNISQLVGDIANQTNMLALNAAVEAVRAGEQGKGFTVVAGEIRKLADESKKSAAKINTVASTIQAAMNSTVMVTDEGTKKASESITLAEKMSMAFTGVKEALNTVAQNTQQITATSKEQAVNVQAVISAMNEVNLGAQETAQGINQVKDNTQRLNQAAKKLSAIV